MSRPATDAGPAASPDVAVVGAGVAGLSAAWRLAVDGARVTVFDPAPGKGATWAAAGMLAPVTEARAAEAVLTRFGLYSLGMWPEFARAVAADAGADGPDAVGLRQEGTLQVAFDEDDRRHLAELAEVHRLMGLESVALTGRECRELVPVLSPRVRGGLRVAGDWQANPRRLAKTLMEAVARRGGRVVTTGVRAVRIRSGVTPAVEGLELDDGTLVRAGTVVLATGASALPAGIPGAVRLPVRPVKGEILRLRTGAEDAQLPLTVRASVQGRSVYVVPRRDGEVVVGATMQEAGYDRKVRAGAVLDLLRAATDVLPVLGELALDEAISGLRPATPDNAPLLGPTAVTGLHAALGYFRNGVLFAPAASQAVATAVRCGRLPEEAAPFHTGRFA